MTSSRIGDEVCKRLARAYDLSLLSSEDFVAPRLRNVSLFEFIVAVMLSQNTSDKNAWRAYENLKFRLGSITPKRVLETGNDVLAELIRVAGMQFERAKRIKELAKAFFREAIDDLIMQAVEQGKFEDARKMLLDLPGVGLKTADVVLLMYYGVPVFPVDTHISRITKRLGFVRSANYEEIRSFWMENTSPSNYFQLHLLLIKHGRETCKARKPLCGKCVIADFCRLGRGLIR